MGRVEILCPLNLLTQMILDPGFIDPDHIAHLFAFVLISHLLLPAIRIKGTVST